MLLPTVEYIAAAVAGAAAVVDLFVQATKAILNV